MPGVFEGEGERRRREEHASAHRETWRMISSSDSLKNGFFKEREETWQQRLEEARVEMGHLSASWQLMQARRHLENIDQPAITAKYRALAAEEASHNANEEEDHLVEKKDVHSHGLGLGTIHKLIHHESSLAHVQHIESIKPPGEEDEKAQKSDDTQQHEDHPHVKENHHHHAHLFHRHEGHH